MTADVSILVSERKDVLKIPNTALRYSPPDGAVYDGTPPKKLDRSQRLVYSPSVDGAKLKPIIIKTGITDGSDTEVTEGLKAGDAVVTSTLTAATKGGFGGPPPQAPE
jgi:HlyD family secretion protein